MMARPAIYVNMLDAHILLTAMTQTPENFQLHCKVLAGEPQLIRALQSVVLFQTTVQLGEHGHPCCVSTRRLKASALSGSSVGAAASIMASGALIALFRSLLATVTTTFYRLYAMEGQLDENKNFGSWRGVRRP
jgi:hypothetical protein